MGRRTDESGAALVEFAIVGVPLMTIIFGGLVMMLDASKLGLTWQQIEFASEATAKCVATNNPPNCPPADPASYAASLVNVVTVPSSAFRVSAQSCGTRVDASYSYTPLWMQASYFAAFLPASVPVTTSACYP
jgi:Flp pilus assembly protein TadG